MQHQIGIVSGSFDPLTNGHVHIIDEALKILDEVIVLVATNPSKRPMFDTQYRIRMIEQSLDGRPIRVLELPKDEMVVSYAKQLGARHIIRGLRDTTDFNYEAQINNAQMKIEPSISTLFFMTPPRLMEVSSSLIKGVFPLRGWEKIIKPAVPAPVFKAFQSRSDIL